MADERPSPEEMLERAAAEEERRKRGRLKLFFGAAPGVGKTYAMLEQAQARRREGVDAVIGWLETHGRAETEALARGLEVLPPKLVEYRDKTLREFDLDGALRRRPALLLVDELAHSNAPGSRHARRWQDVLELLDAGIDVYSTLNVQHVESLNDVVAQITGVTVRETVPDLLVEQAGEIEFVDLPPDELLQRLREGKVYIPVQAERALEGFFRKGNLIALRELALRRVAERVGTQASEYRREHGIEQTWPTRDRILVAVSAAPQSADLVRAAARMARRLAAPWLAVGVETPAFDRLPPSARQQANDHLELAEQLGAETLVLRGQDAAEEILAVARKRNITRIVVGKPTRWRFWERMRGSLVDRLVRGSGGIDIVITTGEPGPVSVPQAARPRPEGSLLQYALALGTVAAATGASWLLLPYVDLADHAMLYLLAILLVAGRCSRGPTLLAIVASVAALDFFFVPPYLTFVVAEFRYVVTFVVLLITGLLVSTLTLRLRRHAAGARQRERRTAALYAMSRDLTSRSEPEAVGRSAAARIRELLDLDVVIFLRGDAGLEALAGAESALARSEHERAVARWVMEHGRPAGNGTETLPASVGLYLPLRGGERVLGVLAAAVGLHERTPAPSDLQLLDTCASLLGVALERALLSAESEQARLAAETERTRSTLLSAVSHDLRTPLAAIAGAAGALQQAGPELDPEQRAELLATIHEEAERLSRLVSDLLELTRIESGAVQPRTEWCPLEEVIASALARLQGPLEGRPVQLALPEEVLLVPMDAALVEQVFVNLLENAVKYTPPGSPIEVRARRTETAVEVEVSDRGPGLPPGEEERIFEKFYRPGASWQIPGTGLGLTVCRAILRIHGGRIRAENRLGGGARFVVELPLGGAPPPPELPEA
ncbi:MAG: sensor histidine kinase KdpD [Planctomycetota bacterium]|nr:MAG: sensor histidine kinase KdpD [Planctomycetota bacterium]